MKETLIHDDRLGNITTRTNQAGTVLDKEEMKFKTTVRETLDSQDTNVNLRTGNGNRGVVLDTDDIARRTVKETTLFGSMDKNLKGNTKLIVYDPDHIARRTIRETTSDNHHIGHMGGVAKDGAYMTNDYTAPETNRQFTSDNEYVGIMDGEAQGGLGYITNEYTAPETSRQFTSDNEYEGGAQSMFKKQMTYDTMYAARTNQVREGTLVGRVPTAQGAKKASGKEFMNIHVDKLESDQLNTRPMVSTKITNLNSNMSSLGMTQTKLLAENSFLERIQPEFLDAFKSNPYTQSLQSYAYT